MERRAVIGFFAIFLLLLSVVGLAEAVGFANAPKDRDILFQPDETIEIPIYVTGAQNIQVTFRVQRESDPATLGTPDDDNLHEYISIDDPAPTTGQRRVNLLFDFPSSLSPGVYPVDITASEVVPGAAGITARAAMKMRFTVRVLSDEVKLDVIDVHTDSIPEGIDAESKLKVISRTTQTIVGAQGEIYVYQGDNLVASGKTDSFSLLPAEEKVLDAKLSTRELKGGEYRVNATVFYGDKTDHSRNKILKVGALRIDVIDHTEQLIYNTTNRFTFLLENQWNKELKDVFANVKLGNQDKKTASRNVPAFSDTEYEVYFDRDETIGPGPDTINITVTYKDYDPELERYIEKEDSIPVNVQIVKQSVEEKPMIPTTLLVMYILVGLLILLLIGVLIVLLRKPRRHEDHPVSP